jgi:hypothetical protein
LWNSWCLKFAFQETRQIFARPWVAASPKDGTSVVEDISYNSAAFEAPREIAASNRRQAIPGLEFQFLGGFSGL